MGGTAVNMESPSRLTAMMRGQAMRGAEVVLPLCHPGLLRYFQLVADCLVRLLGYVIRARCPQPPLALTRIPCARSSVPMPPDSPELEAELQAVQSAISAVHAPGLAAVVARFNTT